MSLSPEVAALARGVRVVVSDVDGVLTDGGIWIDERGVESRRFHVSDGAAVVYLKRAGIPTALISGRRGPALDYRAADLGIVHVFQGVRDKDRALTRVLDSLHLAPAEACYIGDDLLDLPALRMVGLPVAVADACDEVKAAARYVTRRPGGHGAFREVAEAILKAQGRWAEVVAAAGRPLD